MFMLSNITIQKEGSTPRPYIYLLYAIHGGNSSAYYTQI